MFDYLAVGFHQVTRFCYLTFFFWCRKYDLAVIIRDINIWAEPKELFSLYLRYI